jgi:sortase A
MIRRWVQRGLLIAGIAGVGIWALANLAGTAFQHWQDSVFERERLAERTAPKSARKPRLPDGALVGRLTVPRLHMHAMVREGAGDGNLSLALGHIPGTALPGQHGNVGVAGHRDTLFRGLKSIAKDDLIEFQTVGGNYTYRVESTQVVSPDDVAVLKSGPDAELTLVTCYPFRYVGPAPDRFIVKARQVEARQVSQNRAGRDTAE